MSFYKRKKNAEEFLLRTQGHSGYHLIDKLRTVLPARAEVLELGMGSGTDFDLLSTYYRMTGSDYSKPLLSAYRAENPDADLLLLDARTLKTARHFDGIFSNKVLHHLTRKGLDQSLRHQRDRLRPGGWILHSFWRGQGQEKHRGLLYTYWQEDSLRQRLTPAFRNIEFFSFGDAAPADSIAVLAQRR